MTSLGSGRPLDVGGAMVNVLLKIFVAVMFCCLLVVGMGKE
jgi:hypothetical protein